MCRAAGEGADPLPKPVLHMCHLCENTDYRYPWTKTADDGPGPQVIVYIENKKRVFVRDSPHFIQGIADLLKIQGIPYRTYRNEEIENIENLFEGLEVYKGWYDWMCFHCGRQGRTTEKDFECHQGVTAVTPSNPGVY